MNIDLRLGDCLEVLKTIPDNSVDSVVTDPPYHLTTNTSESKGFMGKEWDGGDIAFRTDVWEECLRILKPGGHLLAFSHSRTYHRMGVAIEDAGFEIRDQIMWIYGSGFPKSHNISKQFDKRGGNNHLVDEVSQKLKEARESRGISKGEADKLFCDGTTNYMWFEGRKDGVRLPDDVSFEKICDEWSELKPYQDKIRSANREIVGNYDGDMGGLGGERLGNSGGDITISATDVAKQWEGWGTALKPAHEPIVMARKPLSEKSIAENVLKHGTGGINIDGSRIGTDDTRSKASLTALGQNSGWNAHNNKEVIAGSECGRFPANIIFDEEAGQLLGESSRFFYCPKTSKKDRNEGLVVEKEKNKRPIGVAFNNEDDLFQQGTGNNHPTVKPTDLMRYLINLVTPPNGTTLDPFMGSGSTGKAAIRCGVNFIGIEKEQEYMDIAKARIEHEQNKPIQQSLF